MILEPRHNFIVNSVGLQKKHSDITVSKFIKKIVNTFPLRFP